MLIHANANFLISNRIAEKEEPLMQMLLYHRDLFRMLRSSIDIDLCSFSPRIIIRPCSGLKSIVKIYRNAVLL